MDNLHLSVITVVLYFNIPGSVRTKSQQIVLDMHRHSDCWWDGEFLLNCSFTGISAVPEDTPQTAVTADFSYNNIKTFLCTDRRNEEWMLKHLNLSNNLISKLSLTTCRNLPVLETLNLNDNAIHTLSLDIPTPAHGSNKHRKVLPALKVLSVERNNLNTVPRGKHFRILKDLTPRGKLFWGLIRYILLNSECDCLINFTSGEGEFHLCVNAETEAKGLFQVGLGIFYSLCNCNALMSVKHNQICPLRAQAVFFLIG